MRFGETFEGLARRAAAGGMPPAACPPNPEEALSAAGVAPRVAVVIPTYNYARFLQAALRSVRDQTVAAAEIIVVDDGSDDDPAAVLAAHPDVRLIRQEHLGLGAARNTGWRAAQSEFVVFLDADDRLKPEAIAYNLQQFQADPRCGMAYGAFCTVKVATGAVFASPVKSPGHDPVASFLRGNRIGMHGAVMYRRDVLEQLGGFDPDLPACEDYDLYIRAVFSVPISSRPEILAEYVRHDMNMSHDAGMMLQSALAVLRRYRPWAQRRPEWLQAFREGQAGLIDCYVNSWVDAYRRAPDWRARAALHPQGLKIAQLAPFAFAKALLEPAIGAVRRRAPRALLQRQAQ